MGLLRVFWNGLRLRCPHCGTGRVFASYLRMDDGCVECSHVYQRDRGDWTGSAEITIIFSAGAAFAVALTLKAFPAFDQVPLMAVGLVSWLLLFPLVFRRVKGAWVALLYVWSGRCRAPSLDDKPVEPLVKLVP